MPVVDYYRERHKVVEVGLIPVCRQSNDLIRIRLKPYPPLKQSMTKSGWLWINASTSSPKRTKFRPHHRIPEPLCRLERHPRPRPTHSNSSALQASQEVRLQQRVIGMVVFSITYRPV